MVEKLHLFQDTTVIVFLATLTLISTYIIDGYPRVRRDFIFVVLLLRVLHSVTLSASLFVPDNVSLATWLSTLLQHFAGANVLLYTFVFSAPCQPEESRHSYISRLFLMHLFGLSFAEISVIVVDSISADDRLLLVLAPAFTYLLFSLLSFAYVTCNMIFDVSTSKNTTNRLTTNAAVNADTVFRRQSRNDLSTMGDDANSFRNTAILRDSLASNEENDCRLTTCNRLSPPDRGTRTFIEEDKNTRAIRRIHRYSFVENKRSYVYDVLIFLLLSTMLANCIDDMGYIEESSFVTYYVNLSPSPTALSVEGDDVNDNWKIDVFQYRLARIGSWTVGILLFRLFYLLANETFMRDIVATLFCTSFTIVYNVVQYNVIWSSSSSSSSYAAGLVTLLDVFHFVPMLSVMGMITRGHSTHLALRLGISLLFAHVTRIGVRFLYICAVYHDLVGGSHEAEFLLRIVANSFLILLYVPLLILYTNSHALLGLDVAFDEETLRVITVPSCRHLSEERPLRRWFSESLLNRSSRRNDAFSSPATRPLPEPPTVADPITVVSPDRVHSKETKNRISALFRTPNYDCAWTKKHSLHSLTSCCVSAPSTLEDVRFERSFRRPPSPHPNFRRYSEQYRNSKLSTFQSTLSPVVVVVEKERTPVSLTNPVPSSTNADTMNAQGITTIKNDPDYVEIMPDETTETKRKRLDYSTENVSPTPSTSAPRLQSSPVLPSTSRMIPAPLYASSDGSLSSFDRWSVLRRSVHHRSSKPKPTTSGDEYVQPMNFSLTSDTLSRGVTGETKDGTRTSRTRKRVSFDTISFADNTSGYQNTRFPRSSSRY